LLLQSPLKRRVDSTHLVAEREEAKATLGEIKSVNVRTTAVSSAQKVPAPLWYRQKIQVG
jgi:hypothetical protein